MKTITTTAAAILALAPLGAQAAGLALPAPAALTAPVTAPAGTDAQPVFLDLAQVEGDLLRLLRGNGGDSRDRGGNGRDSNGGNSNGGDSNGGDSNGGDSNGGNSNGGNSGNSGDS